MNKGYNIIWSTIVFTIFLWILSIKSLSDFVNYPLPYISEFSSLTGIVLLSWSMFLSTRLDFLQTWFNGYDKVYKAHRKVSIWGLSLIIIHALALALNRFSGFGDVIKYMLPFHHHTYINLGVFGLWLFIFIVAISIFRKNFKIRYDIWKFLHKFTGIALILGFIHMILIPHGISSLPILNLWTLLITSVGVASWIYIEFIYTQVFPNHKYKITKIIHENNTYKISLEAIDEKMKYKVGQFAYVSFINDEITKEVHPFSMTSHPDEKAISFGIKVLGDYTKTLGNLKAGDIAVIRGPYGTFADRLLESKKDSVFIGGGIGIAPFVSMMKEIQKENGNRHSHIYYCTKHKSDACFDGEFKSTSKNIDYINVCSRETKRLTVTEINENVKNLPDTLVFICGPKKMIEPLTKDLISKNVPQKNISTEDFEIL